MKSQNVYTAEKTLEELELELKQDEIVDREIAGDTTNYVLIDAIMQKIESKRRELARQSFPSEYTQKKLAEKAGIGLSTYKDYLSGISYDIKLKTFLNIAHVLRCKPSDLIDESIIDRRN